MNLDDESYLSAYLDDELDPADRLAVEWSIEASPPLADRLRSIGLVRDAVAGLDRPAIPRDLAPAVGSRIASNRRKARPRLPGRVALAASGFAGFAAIAASLVFALIRLDRSLHESPEIPKVAVQVEQATPVRTHPIEPSDPAPIPPAPSPLLVQQADGPIKPPPDPPVEAPDVGRAPSEGDDRRLIGGMLEKSHVRRIVIVTDVIDAPERVRDLIAQGGRETPEFGRISIRQEIIIDPDHAEAAEVFAVPIDERGRRSFVDRLQRAFPELIEEGRSSPELVGRLTEVGQVAVFRGLKAAPLGDPPSDLPGFIANRERERDPFLIEAARHPAEPAPSKKPAPARPQELTKGGGESGAVPASLDLEFVGPPDLDRKAPPKPGERVTLLVWVTRSGRR